MRTSLRIRAGSLVLLASAVLGWLLYDAGTVRRALGLEPVMSEAAVAIVGLGIAGAGLATAAMLWMRSRRSAPAR
jgi:hypothetical protein